MPAKGKYKVGKGSKPIELMLPSKDEDGNHNVCLVKRPGVQGLIAAGLLDSFDSLTGLVGLHFEESEGKQALEEGVRALSENKEKLKDALDLIDKVVVFTVVEPSVLPLPDGDWLRDPDALYIDEVDIDDKMFILNFVVGGTSDLEAFREGTEQLVGGISAGKVISLPSL